MALRFKKIEILVSESEEEFLRVLHKDVSAKHGNVGSFLSDTIDALDNDHKVIITDVNPRQLKKEKKYGDT